MLMDNSISLLSFRFRSFLQRDLGLRQWFSFFTASGFFVLLPWCLPCRNRVQNLPEFIEAGKGLLFFHTAPFDNPYKLVGDFFPTSVDA
jgi:hypothetical protein